MYGGYDPTKSIVYDDVYVLSVPSFTWTKVASGGVPRFGHTCNTAAKRQMLVVGGAHDANMHGVETTGNLPDMANVTCRREDEVSIFDLSTLTWGTFFNATAPDYQVPDKVAKVIGGK